MRFQNKAYPGGGENEDAAVIRGSEKIISQNLYSAYNDVMIATTKGLFNSNHFDSGKNFLIV